MKRRNVLTDCGARATEENERAARGDDPRFTKQLLYQLSYGGDEEIIAWGRERNWTGRLTQRFLKIHTKPRTRPESDVSTTSAR